MEKWYLGEWRGVAEVENCNRTDYGRAGITRIGAVTFPAEDRETRRLLTETARRAARKSSPSKPKA